MANFITNLANWFWRTHAMKEKLVRHCNTLIAAMDDLAITAMELDQEKDDPFVQDDRVKAEKLQTISWALQVALNHMNNAAEVLRETKRIAERVN